MLKRRKVFVVGAIDDKLAKATCIQVVTFHATRLGTNHSEVRTTTAPKRAPGPSARAQRARHAPSPPAFGHPPAPTSVL
jgi:hypothetical protein